MESELKTRLAGLKEEYQKGQKRLIALEQETAELSNTMLRISGAIQVLEELLGGQAPANSSEVSSGFEMGENKVDDS